MATPTQTTTDSGQSTSPSAPSPHDAPATAPTGTPVGAPAGGVSLGEGTTAPPVQHGAGAHSHGAGTERTGSPALSRGLRPTSYEVGDFRVPTGREEEWRFTPLGRLGSLLEPVGDGAQHLTASLDLPAGATHDVTLAERHAAYVPGDRAAAVAWADASGAAQHVRIAADAELDEPVVVRLTSTGGRAVGHLVVDAGHHSRATVVVEHTGGGQGAAVTSGVEVRVGDGANLTVVSVQQWDDGTVHLAQQDALVGRDATFRHVAVSLGGTLVRMGATVRYAGPGGDATLLGVYFADAGQHLEHRSFIDHQAPSCRSNVTYKGALQGATARTVWVGDVLIGEGALGTDTYELNRNLVLTDGARADSVPNLEIETGEIVGAGHASATGRFDDEQLFYLQARGIPADVARRMVVRAFFFGVLQQIGVPGLTERLAVAIDAELAGAPAPVLADGALGTDELNTDELGTAEPVGAAAGR